MRDRAEDLRGDLLQRAEQEVHGPVGGVVGEPRAALDEHPLGHPAGGGQLGGRLQRPLRGQREDHPLGGLARPAAARPRPGGSPGPISSRSHSRSSTHAPPIRRESSTSTSPAAAAAAACSGSRNRLIEATSRRQCLPVHQVRPAEVVDHLGDRAAGPRVPLVVRQLQVRHHGAVLVPPPRLSQVHAYKSSHPASPTQATRRNSCAYGFPGLRHPRASLTRGNDRDQALKCLRTAEVRLEYGSRWTAMIGMLRVP